MKIMANNLERQFKLYQSDYEKKALDVLRSGWYVLGEELSSFEDEFANYIGTRYCVGLGSGLDALWIGIKSLDIGQGDEVIVCSSAYIACVMGITIPGATPVFVEPDEYYNIDASKIEASITKRTKAILAVHLFGQSCDMSAIMDIARRHDLKVVEDCAQSHGNHWHNQTVGTFGDIGCFSFYPTKGCGAFGDGGAVTTNQLELAEKLKMIRNYGSREKYQFETVGTNSRLDELQAGLLRVKLTHLDALNKERVAIAERYTDGITNPVIQLPKIRPGADSTWHQYVVRTSKRDALAKHLEAEGIGSTVHYPIPPHLSKAYSSLGYSKGDFPIAEKYANEVLSLPIYNGMTENEQQYVIKAANAFGK